MIIVWAIGVHGVLMLMTMLSKVIKKSNAINQYAIPCAKNRPVAGSVYRTNLHQEQKNHKRNKHLSPLLRLICMCPRIFFVAVFFPFFSV